METTLFIYKKLSFVLANGQLIYKTYTVLVDKFTYPSIWNYISTECKASFQLQVTDKLSNQHIAGYTTTLQSGDKTATADVKGLVDIKAVNRKKDITIIATIYKT